MRLETGLRRVLLPALVAASLAAPIRWPAQAQMQLPGAVGGGAASSGGGGGGGGGPPAAPKPVVIEAPGEEMIAAHALSLDGAKGEMVFDRNGAGDKAGLTLSKLLLAGDKISKPGQGCTVNVALAPPLAATPAGRPAGAVRYDVPLQACPFTIDILDGAALVTSAGPTCDFPAADCRVNPGGLWGPRAADISPKQAQELEHSRVRLETTMRANFHALLRKAGKDKAAIKAIAREQAAFSSEREMTCRDYQDETKHGFCSTQITEARALALLAQFGPVKVSHERKLATKPKPRPAAAETAPDDEPPP